MTATHPATSRRRARRTIDATAIALLVTALPVVAVPAEQPLEEIVVTATRRPTNALATPLSLDAVGRQAIELVGSTHHSETMNRIAGVMIQRGSGQESLTAIRSPVLTGAGACGGFLFLENDVPIRPVGFCNVNELMEINTEQAQAIEILRGPGTALHGSNALHGLVNVRQPTPEQRPQAYVGLDAGPDAYGRLELAGGLEDGPIHYGAAGLYTHDGGWRDHSGYDEAKLNLTAAGRWRETPMRFDLAATWLEQDTAGFILGQGAYRVPALRTENLNPEAYRDASAVRLTGLIAPPLASGARLEFRPYLRSSRMQFLQHFLLGQPLERNGQESAGLMSSVTWGADPARLLVTGLDLEIADSFLQQYQANPTTDGPPPANAIRPAGWQYDYEVRSYVAAAYAHLEQRFAERWRATAGLRAEWVTYDYDNAMIAGNTNAAGVPCAPAGCLYSRPADRSDGYFNLAPKLSVAVDLRDGLLAYANATMGFRPPEITELYRLQRQQRVAELDSERLDALELGLKGSWSPLDLELALFDMRKHDVILRDSSGNNVSGGVTSHRGLEYLLRWRATDQLSLAASGTFARHRYDFSRNVEGGERIVDGNEIDTAPERIYRFAAEWQPVAGVATEIEWQAVGPYYLDASNEHGYSGHGVLNVRARWRATPQWAFTLRLNNVLDRYFADRADYAFGEYRYFPGRGRALFAEVAWARE